MFIHCNRFHNASPIDACENESAERHTAKAEKGKAGMTYMQRKQSSKEAAAKRNHFRVCVLRNDQSVWNVSTHATREAAEKRANKLIKNSGYIAFVEEY